MLEHKLQFYLLYGFYSFLIFIFYFTICRTFFLLIFLWCFLFFSLYDFERSEETIYFIFFFFCRRLYFLNKYRILSYTNIGWVLQLLLKFFIFYRRITGNKKLSPISPLIFFSKIILSLFFNKQRGWLLIYLS